MKKIVFLIASTFWLYSISAQQSKLPQFITDSLETYITKGMIGWQIPGLSIAIVKNGKIFFLKGFGVNNINSNEPVNENTLFMIGSNTKAFTATAITMLQSEGKLNLEDKVQKWMPGFKLKDTLASKEVNIADLLSHRIGFETFQGDFTYWTSSLSRMEVINKMRFIDAPYGFRTKWGYCNAAFLTSGELMARVAGKPWEEVISEKILTPLKMTHTLLLSESLKSAHNRASPHTIIDDKLTVLPIANLDNLAPAASMSSCARDMAVWLQTQLDNGIFEGKQVIPNNAIQETRKPYSIIKLDARDKQETHFYLYGLGLKINDRNGKLVYSHTGGVDGFLSSVMFVPEENFGIVVLTNSDKNYFFLDLTNEIRDAFLGLPYQGYSYKSLKTFNLDKINSSNTIDSLENIIRLHYKPSIPLENYSGTYTNQIYGEIKIKLEGNNLNIYFSNHPNLIGKLEFIQRNSFLCTYSNPTMGIKEIPFKTENGKVIGLTLHVSDFIEYTPYEFIKK